MSPRHLNESSDFPRLTRQNHCITSDQDNDYNCIAWALAGEKTRWWWPHPFLPEYYWPDGVRRDNIMEAFVEVLGRMGFEECLSFDREEGYVRVVIYADERFGQVSPTHAARQRADGQWTSKLGSLEDITHSDPFALGGGLYGRPIRCYRKRLRPGEYEDMACL